jgi:hypothetical protein
MSNVSVPTINNKKPISVYNALFDIFLTVFDCF